MPDWLTVELWRGQGLGSGLQASLTPWSQTPWSALTGWIQGKGRVLSHWLRARQAHPKLSSYIFMILSAFSWTCKLIGPASGGAGTEWELDDCDINPFFSVSCPWFARIAKCISAGCKIYLSTEKLHNYLPWQEFLTLWCITHFSSPNTSQCLMRE